MIDYYEILGISETSEPEVIAAAYKAMMRKYHPDNNKSPSADERARLINEAYDVLKSPLRRREYDAKRSQSKLQRNASSLSERSSIAGANVQGSGGANVGIIAVPLLALFVLGIFVFGGGKPQEVAPSGGVGQETSDAVKCLEDVESQQWQTAVIYCSAAADEGNPVAQRLLGSMFAKGNRVVQDYATAVSWYRKAAAQGDAEAIQRLAELQMTSEGKDLKQLPQPRTRRQNEGKRPNKSNTIRETEEQAMSKMCLDATYPDFCRRRILYHKASALSGNGDAIPRGNIGRWVNGDDWPSKALQQEREGVAAFIVTVGADGYVSNCQITASSGHEDLDAATCKYVKRRARFLPAAVNGEEVQGSYSNRVRWQLP
jgi:TonB family protein